MEYLNVIKNLLEDNPLVFLVFFVISLMANFIEIFVFVRTRRQYKDELNEKLELKKIVNTYEYILNLAEKNLKSENQLKNVETEILTKRNLSTELSERIEILKKEAQKKLISKSIENKISNLAQINEEIAVLRQEYSQLGELPDIPKEKRDEIEKEVSFATKSPFELPRSMSFRIMLFVLIVFLLPYPTDSLFVIVFLHLFLNTFFGVIEILKEQSVSKWARKYKNIIGFASAFGLWYSLTRYIVNSIPLLSEFFYHGFLNVIIQIIAILGAIVHWKLIKDYVLSPFSEK